MQSSFMPLRRGLIPAMAMAFASLVVAADLPAWSPVAGFRDNAGFRDDPVPVTVAAAVPVKAGGVQGSPSASKKSMERPGRPTCAAEGKVALRENARAGYPGGSVGCGAVPPNLAAVGQARFADFTLHRQDALGQPS